MSRQGGAGFQEEPFPVPVTTGRTPDDRDIVVGSLEHTGVPRGSGSAPGRAKVRPPAPGEPIQNEEGGLSSSSPNDQMLNRKTLPQTPVLAWLDSNR